MASTNKPVFVPGVWGPYADAMVRGTWLLEGGQSAAGAALDRIVAAHPAAVEAREAAGEKGMPNLLERRALEVAAR